MCLNILQQIITLSTENAQFTLQFTLHFFVRVLTATKSCFSLFSSTEISSLCLFLSFCRASASWNQPNKKLTDLAGSQSSNGKNTTAPLKSITENEGLSYSFFEITRDILDHIVPHQKCHAYFLPFPTYLSNVIASTENTTRFPVGDDLSYNEWFLKCI